MDFGFNLPTRGPLATRESMLALAKRGEQLGYAYLAIPDHILIPRTIGSPYPYSATRKMGAVGEGDCMEELTVMSFLAGATSKIRLLSSVMVVPHRPAVFTAKALATLDVLSQGRVTVGIGAGWMEEEFRAIGALPFAERGKVTDEYLRVFKALWTEDNPRYEGKYVQFDNVSFLPKPVQKPHPPIWVGGESPPAVRRTVALGDAWFPIGSNPEFPLNTVERFSQGIARLHEEARRAGRDPASITLAYWASWYKEGQTLTVDNGQRQVLTGSDDDVIQDIDAFRSLDVRHLLVTFARPTLAESITAMERFSDKVLSRV